MVNGYDSKSYGFGRAGSNPAVVVFDNTVVYFCSQVFPVGYLCFAVESERSWIQLWNVRVCLHCLISTIWSCDGSSLLLSMQCFLLWITLIVLNNSSPSLTLGAANLVMRWADCWLCAFALQMHTILGLLDEPEIIRAAATAFCYTAPICLKIKVPWFICQAGIGLLHGWCVVQTHAASRHVWYFQVHDLKSEQGKVSQSVIGESIWSRPMQSQYSLTFDTNIYIG